MVSETKPTYTIICEALAHILKIKTHTYTIEFSFFILNLHSVAGYKIEAPKLEFGDSKHGDYILKPDYHKLDYPPVSGVKTQNEFLLKSGSEYPGIKTSEYPGLKTSEYPGLKEYPGLSTNAGKIGEGYGHLEHEAGAYSEKYFHPKQF